MHASVYIGGHRTVPYHMYHFTGYTLRDVRTSMNVCMADVNDSMTVCVRVYVYVCVCDFVESTKIACIS